MPAVSTGFSLDEIIEISCDLDAVYVQPVSQQPRPPTQIHEEPHAPADTDVEMNTVHGGSGELYIPRRVGLGELVPLGGGRHACPATRAVYQATGQDR